MERKQTGDFQKAWNRSSKTIKQQCIMLAKNRFEADDLFHDTWLRAFSHWKKRCTDEKKLTNGYFKQIAKHAFIDQYRKKERTTLFHDTEHSNGLTNRISELSYLVEPLVLHLTKKQLGIFLLADVYKWKLSDIAFASNTTTGAVKASLFRARQNVNKHVRRQVNEGCLLPKEEMLHVQLISAALSYEDTALLVQLINGSTSLSRLYSQNNQLLSPKSPKALAA